MNTSTRLSGIRGWLLFFTIIAVLAGVTQLVQLPSVIVEGNINTILHTLLLVTSAFLAFILIILKKREAKFAYIFFIIVFPVGGFLVRMFQLHEPIKELYGPMVFVMIIIILVSGYFLRSKRVHNTFS